MPHVLPIPSSPWIAKQGCYQAPDSEWHYAGSVEYSGYTAIKEVCDNLEPWARVVIDSDSHVRLFTFNDDGIEHVNVVRFKSEKRPLLFVMTIKQTWHMKLNIRFRMRC